MKFSAAQIAQIINGTIVGDAERSVGNFAKIEEAKEGDLAFLANPKYTQYLLSSEASVIIINTDFLKEPKENTTYILVPDAYAAFTLLLQTYQDVIAQASRKSGIHSAAVIEESATIHEMAYVGALVYIGNHAKVQAGTVIHPQSFIGHNVTIGTDCMIHPGVKILDNCVIGDRVVLHAGVVIGSDGFGFAPDAAGVYSKVPQLGNVIIHNDVEIGANTTIDRATMGATVIHSGVKIDNLVQIAHNVVVHSHTVIAAQAGISGSTKVGAHCIIGGQAGIVGHIELAEGSKINAQSGVSKSIKKPHQALTGSPAFDYYASIKSQALTRQLPSIVKRLEALEQHLK